MANLLRISNYAPELTPYFLMMRKDALVPISIRTAAAGRHIVARLIYADAMGKKRGGGAGGRGGGRSGAGVRERKRSVVGEALEIPELPQTRRSLWW